MGTSSWDARKEIRLSIRRGAELEEALLDAAWQQLLTAGYGGFTVDAVAERAHTSKPVLYRRWPTREDLLLALVRHQGEVDMFPSPTPGGCGAT
ncbi:TetR/AcrR family transcriptional regulator [Cellulomonas hominis]